jgi:hypothetical protein
LNVGFAFESVNRWKKKSKGARSFPLWTRNERFRWRGLVARSQSIHRFIFWLIRKINPGPSEKKMVRRQLKEW